MLTLPLIPSSVFFISDIGFFMSRRWGLKKIFLGLYLTFECMVIIVVLASLPVILICVSVWGWFLLFSILVRLFVRWSLSRCRCYEFYFVRCWVFLYSYEYPWALFWGALKSHGNNLILLCLLWFLLRRSGAVVSLVPVMPHYSGKTFWALYLSMTCESFHLLGERRVCSPPCVTTCTVLSNPFE